MAGSVVTCIQCRKPFKQAIDDYQRHAHLLEKVGVILKMSITRPCSIEGVRVGEKAPSESTLLFSTSFKCPNFFPPVSLTNSRHHAKLFDFSTILAFSGVYLVKNS